MDTSSLVGLPEAPALPLKGRSRLAARFRITAHWLLVAAGRALAIVLLALAGTQWQGPGTPPRPVTWGGSGQPAKLPSEERDGSHAAPATRDPVPLPGPAGIAHPSAFSSVYFLVFVAVCTWWACHLPVSALGVSALCVAVGCFGAGHLICLYCYQMPLAQVVLPPASIWAR